MIIPPYNFFLQYRVYCMYEFEMLTEVYQTEFGLNCIFCSWLWNLLFEDTTNEFLLLSYYLLDKIWMYNTT